MATNLNNTAELTESTLIGGQPPIEHYRDMQVSVEYIVALAEAVGHRLDGMHEAARNLGGTAFTESAWKLSSSLLSLVRDQARTVGKTCEMLEIARMHESRVSG